MRLWRPQLDFLPAALRVPPGMAQETEKVDFGNTAAVRDSDISDANLLAHAASQGRNVSASSRRSLELSPSREAVSPYPKPVIPRRYTAGFERTLPLEKYPSGSHSQTRRETNRLEGKREDGHGLGGLKRELRLKERVRHFTWTWFTMSMATGGIANVLYTSMSFDFLISISSFALFKMGYLNSLD